MSDCAHDCSSCGESCKERTAPQNSRAPASGLSRIGKIIAMVGGKGGMGRGLVTSSLVVAIRRMGKTVDVLDTDITGPSIPTVFGIHAKTKGSELGIYPVGTEAGIEIMSLNLLTENETDPVVWRSPVIAGAVKQFWTDVIQDDADYLLVDMLPGTGDVPLTVFQSLPVDGIVVVTTPQDPVSMIVAKAVKMAEMIRTLVLGLVESYSYLCCSDCGKKHAVFDESHVKRVVATPGLKVPIRLPIDPAVAAACDAGRIEELDLDYLTAIVELLAE